MERVIRIHPAAPPKPAEGLPCNGCGVCCLAEPCPLGVIASRRRHGACAALVWHDDQAMYRCGLIAEPEAHLPRVLHRLSPLLARIAKRYIASGAGCDSDLAVSTSAGRPDAEAIRRP